MAVLGGSSRRTTTPVLLVKPMVSVSPAKEQLVAAEAVGASQASTPTTTPLSKRRFIRVRVRVYGGWPVPQRPGGSAAAGGGRLEPGQPEVAPQHPLVPQ